MASSQLLKVVESITDEWKLAALAIIALLIVIPTIASFVKSGAAWVAALIFVCMSVIAAICIGLIYELRQHPEMGSKLVARASQQELQNIRAYDYIIWLDMPLSQKANASSVEYYFTDPSATLRTRSSSTRSNGFAVTYRGVACYDNLAYKIRYINDTTETGSFNMCNALKN